MLNEASRYYKNSNAKKGRKTLAFFFDYSITLILMVFFYVVINFAFSFSPSKKSLYQNVSLAQDNLYTFVEETNLGVFNSGAYRLYSSDEISSNYVKANVYRSLKDAGYSDVEISYTSYVGIKPISSESDALYMYYSSYKPNNLSLYNEGYDSSAIGADYYKNNCIKINENKFYTSDDYPLINKETAVTIDNYFRNNSYSLGYTNYTLIFNNYLSAYNNALNEVTTYNKTYIDLLSTFDTYRIKTFNYDVSEILVSYLLGFLTGYIVPILIFKDGKTIGIRVLNLAYVRSDDKKPNYKNLLLRGVFDFFLEFFIVVIFVLMIFNTSGVYLLMHNYFGLFGLFYLSVFSFLLNVISFIYMCFKKTTNQTLSELSSGLILKDTKEYIVTKEENEIDGTSK